MATGTFKWYGQAPVPTATEWANDTFKMSLHTVSYVPNQDTDDFRNDLTNEVTADGYTAGGVTLGTKSVSYDAATNTRSFKCANPAWAASTITARVAVISKILGGASSADPVIGFMVFDANVSSSSGTFTIDLSGNTPAQAILQVVATA